MTYQADDDQYPGRAVVYIEATWGDQTFTGTGFLVGRNDVVTASHVLYDQTLGGTPDSVRLAPSYRPGAFDNVFYDEFYFHYYPDFDPDGDGLLVPGDLQVETLKGSEFDIALISLPQPVGDIYGWFGVDAAFSGGSVGVLGHPGLYGRALMYDDGTVQHHPLDSVLYYGADVEVNPGNSGGPVYYDYGTGPYAVGVVSTGLVATSFRDHWTWIAETMAENDGLVTVTPDSVGDGSAAFGPFSESDIALIHLMLGRAPDAGTAADVAAAGQPGPVETAAALAGSPAFLAQFSGLATLAEKIDVIVGDNMGLEPYAFGALAAVDYFAGAVAAGRTVPDMMAGAVAYLLDDTVRLDVYDAVAERLLGAAATTAAPARRATDAAPDLDPPGVDVTGLADPGPAMMDDSLA